MEDACAVSAVRARTMAQAATRARTRLRWIIAHPLELVEWRSAYTRRSAKATPRVVHDTTHRRPHGARARLLRPQLAAFPWGARRTRDRCGELHSGTCRERGCGARASRRAAPAWRQAGLELAFGIRALPLRSAVFVRVLAARSGTRRARVVRCRAGD